MSNQNQFQFGGNSLDLYDKQERIGSGTYGQVYKGKNKETGEEVALKKMVLKIESEGVPSTTIREISLLREIEHPNIVQLKDVIQEEQTLYLVFEQLHMDLREKLNALEKDEYLSELHIKKILYEIIKGIYAIHAKRILHRDLKPQNILLSKDGKQVKIADFGLSRTYAVPNRPYTHEVVTLWYRPPELLLGAMEYSTPVDVWSIGCIFAEIVTKQALFTGDSEIDQIGRIIRILGTPDNNIWPGVTELKNYNQSYPNYPIQRIEASNKKLEKLSKEGLNLLNKMLTYDPTKRITAKQALKHSYFKDLIAMESQKKQQKKLQEQQQIMQLQQQKQQQQQQQLQNQGCQGYQFQQHHQFQQQNYLQQQFPHNQQQLQYQQNMYNQQQQQQQHQQFQQMDQSQQQQYMQQQYMQQQYMQQQFLQQQQQQQEQQQYQDQNFQQNSMNNQQQHITSQNQQI